MNQLKTDKKILIYNRKYHIDKVQVMQNNGIVNADYTDLLEERQSIPDEVFDIKGPLDSQNEENSDG